MDDLLNIDLPKWPQMLVTGKPVTIDQAKDIILRTDSFLTDLGGYGGNNRQFNEAYHYAAGFGQVVNMASRWKLDGHPFDTRARYEIEQQLREAIGYVPTSYVNNDWASCSFIFGPHGWCSPEGDIYFVDNVGKWPSVGEILNDWRALAKAFPYVDAHVTLMNAESMEESGVPLVNIRVLNGTAELAQPDLTVHASRPLQRSMDSLNLLNRCEQGLPVVWVEEYAAKVRAALDEILPKFAKKEA